MKKCQKNQLVHITFPAAQPGINQSLELSTWDQKDVICLRLQSQMPISRRAVISIMLEPKGQAFVLIQVLHYSFLTFLRLGRCQYIRIRSIYKSKACTHFVRVSEAFLLIHTQFIVDFFYRLSLVYGCVIF